jgi:hypothetical protein
MRARFYVLVAAVALCLLALIAAWGSDAPEMSEVDAIRFSEAALEQAGLQRVRVAGTAQRHDYRPVGATSCEPARAAGDGTVPVWETHSRVRGGTVLLFVHRTEAEAVCIDDEDAHGKDFVTERQVRRLDGVQGESRSDQQRRHDAIGAVALVLLAGAAAGVILVERENAREKARAENPLRDWDLT